MTVGDIAAQARAQWVAMMGSGGAQDRAPGEPDTADLPAPTGLVAVGGRGQVTLRWDPVEGAIGYAVHRATSATGPFAVVDHGGGDVLAVPHGPYADTTVEPEREYWYAVAPLATVTAMGPLCPPVRGAAFGPSDTVTPLLLTVDAAGDDGPLHRPWRFMVGSEHLSHLLETDRTGGREIGPELRAALARVHGELGVETVRAHGILCDDLGVYREVDGEPVHDWAGVDRVYDTVRELGMRPIVELGFMPRDLASDPARTVFTYRGIISPPKDWDRWADLVRSLVAHLVERYGLAEVRDRWAFEVWNEANLSVFWSGTPAEYWRLYEVTARAVKDVDPGLRVGGPATAAVGWISEQLAVDAPVDFLSTHIYGSPPLDLRGIRADLPLWWTEWGVTATHGNEINDTVFAATFLLRGMRSAAGRIESLAPWVASDHFEELGRPPRFLHGGFGLLTVGNLAKPKFWALWLAQRLGDTAIPARIAGDGASSLVETWTARHADGTVGALVWNGTLDHAKRDGDKALDRCVTVRFEGLPGARYEVRQWRVDAAHGNVAARWQSMGGGDWPTDDQWSTLAAEDRLPESGPATTVAAAGGVVEVTVDLPNPAIAYVEVVELR
ncbi:xylan 1,4-beta-xylosidase [Asanoa sp. WMMD1127]|uniref:GH39 family glycosyl hydrolase n=1 Tax=Asanoa sp. WMMD1127 TaxID=3016107 RepID=UPI002415E3F3|nr:xylan 1,4-beta-xylosidase [Asanoa sp. WMMD1127]MDG4825937.1 xylan 1,4-beta-xylosidase [Asanoa sp. WMMD1127]